MRQQKQQKIYEAVLLIFRRHNLHSFSLVPEQKMIQILNSQAQSVIGEDFEERIVDDIWERCLDKGQGIQVVTIAQTFVQAINILKKRIQSLQGQTGLIADRKVFLHDKKYELSLYQEQTQIGNKHVYQLQQTIEQVQAEISQFEQAYESFHKEIKLIETILLGSERKIMPSQQKKQFLEEQSKHLLQILYIASFSLLLEVYLLIFRLSMLTLMCYLQSYFVLFIGYIYSSAVLYLEIQILVSILLDLVFLFLFAENILDYKSVSAALPVNTVVKSIFMGLVILSMILRVVLMWKWRRFIQHTKKSYYFMFWDQKIKLNKRIVVIK